MDNTLSLNQLQARVTPEPRPVTAPRPVAAQAPNTAPNTNTAPPAVVTPPPEPAVTAAETSKELRESLEVLSERLNEFVQDNARELEFMVSDDEGRVVILVRQSETGEVLRTIPPEEAKSLAETLQDGGAALISQQA